MADLEAAGNNSEWSRDDPDLVEEVSQVSPETADKLEMRINYQRRLVHLVCNNKITRNLYKDMIEFVEARKGDKERWVEYAKAKYSKVSARVEGVKSATIPAIMADHYTSELPRNGKVALEFVATAFGNQPKGPVDCLKQISEGVSLETAKALLRSIGMGPGMEIDVVCGIIEQFDGGNEESVRLFYIDRAIDSADEVVRLSVFQPEVLEELELGPTEKLEAPIVEGLLSISSATVRLHDDILYSDEEERLACKGGEDHYLATKMSHLKTLVRKGVFNVATTHEGVASNLVGTIKQGRLYVGRVAREGEEADDPLLAPASREIMVPKCVNTIYSTLGMMPSRNFYCSDEVVRPFVDFIRKQYNGMLPAPIKRPSNDYRPPRAVPTRADPVKQHTTRVALDYSKLLRECSSVDEVMKTFSISKETRNSAKTISAFNKVTKKVLSELDGIAMSVDDLVQLVRDKMGPTHGSRDEEVAIVLGMFSGNLYFASGGVTKRTRC